MKNTGHPSHSWYAATANAFEAGPPIAGDMACDVAIIGAGYTGLGAALVLAERGLKPLVIEQAQTGSGASGRNGGQIHPGHRRDMAFIENTVGKQDALGLWQLAERARLYQRDLIARHAIACDLKPGLIHAGHKASYIPDYRHEVDHLAKVYGYTELEFVEKDRMAALLGTPAYHGGVIDHGGGHLHPLNWALGIAAAAQRAGARISEQTRALSYASESGKAVIRTTRGTVRADFVLIAGDGYLDGLDREVENRVMPINNFILATEPLGIRHAEVLPGDMATSDSRFVVNYWRKSVDGRVLWGGGENYRPGFPADLKGFIRHHMLKIYPQLADLKIDYAWGGTLGITMKRLPFVRRLKPNVLVAAGYSGVGVMLAPYFGKILADAIAGTMGEFDLLGKLPAPVFPGGKMLRWPTMVAGLSYYAMLDRM
jgi:gamma-glutamylputrescine oxidase